MRITRDSVFTVFIIGFFCLRSFTMEHEIIEVLTKVVNVVLSRKIDFPI